MAAALCKSAGWINLELLLAVLSQQAMAGAHPDLLKLLQVSPCTAQQKPSSAPMFPLQDLLVNHRYIIEC